MADPATIGTAVGLGLAAGYMAWRDVVKPRMERRERAADSERPSRSHIATAELPVTRAELKEFKDDVREIMRESRERVDKDVAAVLERVKDNSHQLQHFASADEVATYMATTTETVRELTGEIKQVVGMLQASRGSR